MPVQVQVMVTLLSVAGNTFPIPSSCSACPATYPSATSFACPKRAAAGGPSRRTTTCGSDSSGAISRSRRALACGQVNSQMILICGALLAAAALLFVYVHVYVGRWSISWASSTDLRQGSESRTQFKRAVNSSGNNLIIIKCTSITQCAMYYHYYYSAGAKSWRCEYERLISRIPMVKTDELKEHAHQVLHVSFSHNGKLFATCSKDGYVIVSGGQNGIVSTGSSLACDAPYLDITHFPRYLFTCASHPYSTVYGRTGVSSLSISTPHPTARRLRVYIKIINSWHTIHMFEMLLFYIYRWCFVLLLWFFLAKYFSILFSKQIARKQKRIIITWFNYITNAIYFWFILFIFSKIIIEQIMA